MNKKYINNKGITLIALVVTIIVLIILAGVSINLVLGENGLITRAKEQSKEYETDQILEILELKKAEMVIYKNGGDVSVKEFTDNIKSDTNMQYDITNVEEVDANTANITVDGKYIFSVVKEANGNLKIAFGSEDETTPEQPENPEQNKKLADVAKPGDYVSYTAWNPNASWQVLYNDSTYGLQIVSTIEMTTATFGGNSTSEALGSYVNAHNTFGNIASNCRNTTYATASRIVGSNPVSGAIVENNDDWLIDYNTMKGLGIHNIGTAYWIASKGKETNDENIFWINYIDEDGDKLTESLTFYQSTAGTSTLKAKGTYSKGVRVVVTLKPDLVVTGGNGSVSSKYQVSVAQ